MRELTISTDFETIEVDQSYKRYPNYITVFGGYEGESDATKLKVEVDDDYLDYLIYLMFRTDGTWFEQGPYGTSFEYTIPADYMNSEYLILVVEARMDSEIIKSPPVYLEISR